MGSYSSSVGSGGYYIPILRIANTGEGKVMSPVISKIVQNTLFQKLVRSFPNRKMCLSWPTIPQSLQQCGDYDGRYFETLYWVRYDMKAIFEVSSQWMAHLEDWYIVLKADCHWWVVKVSLRSVPHIR